MKITQEGDYITYTPKSIMMFADIRHLDALKMIVAAIKRDYYTSLKAEEKKKFLEQLLYQEIEEKGMI